jgi:hypothetical protein
MHLEEARTHAEAAEVHRRAVDIQREHARQHSNGLKGR